MDLYFIGDPAAAPWSDPLMWSDMSGGSTGFGPPGPGDRAIFDVNSLYACEIDIDVDVAEIIIDAASAGILSGHKKIKAGVFTSGAVINCEYADMEIGTFSLTGGTMTMPTVTYEPSAKLKITGDADFNGTVYFPYAGDSIVQFAASAGTQQFTTRGKTFRNIKLSGNATLVQVGDLTCDELVIDAINGEWDSNGYNVAGVISVASLPIRPKLTIHAEESGNQVAAAQTEVELAAVGSVEMPVSIDAFVEAIFTPFGGAEQLLDSDTYSFVADDETWFEDIFGANPTFDLPATPGAWGGILRIDVYTDSGKTTLMASTQQVLAATDFPLAEELRYGVKTQYETVTGTSEEMPLTQAWVEVAAEKVGAVQIGQTGYVKGYLSLQQTKTAGVTITLTIAGVPTVVFDDDFNFVAGNWYSIADIVGSEVTFEPAAGEYGINNKIEISVSADGISDPNLSVPFNITDFPAAGQLASGVYTQYGTVEGTMPKPRLRVIANAIDPDTFEIVGACQLGQTVRLAGTIQPESDGSAHLTVTGYDNGVPTLLVDEDFNFVNGVNQTFEDIAGAAIEMTPSPTTRTLTYFEWTISGVDVGTVSGQVQVSVTDFPAASEVEDGVMFFYGTLEGELAAGGGGAVQDASIMDPTETYQILRGSKDTSYPVGGQVVFDADTAGVSIELAAYDITNPAAPVLLGYLIPTGLFDFTAGVPRTLADLAGGTLEFTPTTDGDFLLSLVVAGPSPASADEVVVQFTTQPIGPTPPTPPAPPAGGIPATREYPDNHSVPYQAFTLVPKMMAMFNVTGDWGLKVNEPTYPQNMFFVNSLSGLPALGQTAEFRAAIPAGPYTFRVWAPKGPDCGIVDLYINDFPVAVGVDLYAAALDPNNVIVVPNVLLSNGVQRVKVTVAGKNGASSNFFFRMINMQLVPYQYGTL